MIKVLLLSLLLVSSGVMAQQKIQPDAQNNYQGLYAIPRSTAANKPFAQNTEESIQLDESTFTDIRYDKSKKGIQQIKTMGHWQMNSNAAVLTYDDGTRQTGSFDKEPSPLTHQLTDVLVIGNKHFYKTH